MTTYDNVMRKHQEYSQRIINNRPGSRQYDDYTAALLGILLHIVGSTDPDRLEIALRDARRYSRRGVEYWNEVIRRVKLEREAADTEYESDPMLTTTGSTNPEGGYTP